MKLLATCILLILFAVHSNAFASPSCREINQSGSIEPWSCRNSSNSIRCYADIKLDDSSNRSCDEFSRDYNDVDGFGSGECRIWSNENQCYPSFSDCWFSGKGRVDPC